WLSAARFAFAAGGYDHVAGEFVVGGHDGVEFGLNVVFDVGQGVDVGFAGQRDGGAGVAGARGAADAMHVVLRILRQVVVDDVGDVGDVQAAGGDVGGDHDRQFAGLEVFQQAQALVLGDVAGQGGSAEAVGVKGVVDAFAFAFGVDEHECAFGLQAPQQAGQQRRFVVDADVIERLLDRVHVDGVGVGTNQLGAVH